MFDLAKRMDELSRRRFMEYAAGSLLGVSILPSVSVGAPSKEPKKVETFPGGKTAKRVIYLFMEGAMSHLDTFDLKPGKEVQGKTEGISTAVPGIKIGSSLPKLAKHTDKLSIIRSMHTETADHEGARYLMHTSYKEIASIRHPGLGAWIQEIDGVRKDRSLPDNVVIGGSNRHPGAGFLSPAFTPVPIGDAKSGLQNTKQPDYLKPELFEKRLQLIDSFDTDFRKKFPQKQVEAYTEFYRQATSLMASSDLKVFDINQESKEVRDRYGDRPFGMGCLLARRLAEKDTRFIEVTLGGWDMHVDLFDKVNGHVAQLDQALSALLEDLESRRLLNDTLVVLTTEFGRTPKINQNNGRDHHPAAFSSVLAGGGIAGGRFYGKSDENAHNVDSDGVTVGDFNATIAHALGLPLGKEFFSKSGRPFKVAHDGRPVMKLFA